MHCKHQKDLRKGLNLHPLNYRLARPGIGYSVKEVSEKEGLIAGTSGCCGSDPHPLTPTTPAQLGAHMPHDLTTTVFFRLPSLYPLLFAIYVWCDPATGQL